MSDYPNPQPNVSREQPQERRTRKIVTLELCHYSAGNLPAKLTLTPLASAMIAVLVGTWLTPLEGHQPLATVQVHSGETKFVYPFSSLPFQMEGTCHNIEPILYSP